MDPFRALFLRQAEQPQFKVNGNYRYPALVKIRPFKTDHSRLQPKAVNQNTEKNWQWFPIKVCVPRFLFA